MTRKLWCRGAWQREGHSVSKHSRWDDKLGWVGCAGEEWGIVGDWRNSKNSNNIIYSRQCSVPINIRQPQRRMDKVKNKWLYGGDKRDFHPLLLLFFLRNFYLQIFLILSKFSFSTERLNSSSSPSPFPRLAATFLIVYFECHFCLFVLYSYVGLSLSTASLPALMT